MKLKELNTTILIESKFTRWIVNNIKFVKNKYIQKKRKEKGQLLNITAFSIPDPTDGITWLTVKDNKGKEYLIINDIGFQDFRNLSNEIIDAREYFPGSNKQGFAVQIEIIGLGELKKDGITPYLLLSDPTYLSKEATDIIKDDLTKKSEEQAAKRTPAEIAKDEKEAEDRRSFYD